MKSTLKYLLILFFSTLLVGCSSLNELIDSLDKDNQRKSDESDISIHHSGRKKITLTEGQQISIYWSTTPSSKKISTRLYSFDQNRVEISEEFIRGKKAGPATAVYIIDTTQSPVQYLEANKIEVTVVESSDVKLDSIKIIVPSGNILVGNSYIFKYEVSPAKEVNVNWSSSDTSVGTISSKGVFKALKEGYTTIYVETVGNNQTYTSLKTISVKSEETGTPESQLPAPTGLSITGPATLTQYDKENYSVSVTPTDADASVEWTILPSELASVDKDGNVSAFASGNVVLYATAHANTELVVSKAVTIESYSPGSSTGTTPPTTSDPYVTIENAPEKMSVGDSINLWAREHNGYTGKTFWSVDKSELATIGGTTGRLKALKPGTIVVKIQAGNTLENVATKSIEIEFDSTYLDTIYASLLQEQTYANGLKLDFGNTSLTLFEIEYIIDKIVSDNRASDVTAFSLYSKNLKQLPANIIQFTNLETLYIASIGINTLPDIFEHFPKLKSFTSYSNDFDSLPDSFLALSNLKTLYLDGTSITDFSSLKQIQTLQSLALGHCNFTSIPEAIFELNALRYLSITYTPLKSIPEDILLTSIESLNFHSCDFVNIPRVLSDMNSLTYLSMTYNTKLIGFASDFQFSKSKIRQLYLIKNNIKDISSDILTMPSLNSIYVWGNPLSELALSILNQLKSDGKKVYIESNY